jgi:two-component system response regulator DesR
MPADGIRVLCVDDNAALVQALQVRLSHEPDIITVGHLLSADGLLEEVAQREPNIVLLDLDMPGRDAMLALRELSATYSNVRTVILSGYVREDLINRALDAGAWGYIAKSEDPDVIVDALRRVAGGSFAFGLEVAKHLGKAWNRTATA